MAKKKSTTKTTKKTTVAQGKEIKKKSVSKNSPSLKNKTSVKTESSFIKNKFIIGIVSLFIIIFLFAIWITMNQTLNDETLLVDVAGPVIEPEEETKRINLIEINEAKNYNNENIAVEGQIFSLTEIKYENFIYLLQDENKNNLYFIPKSKEQYIPRETYDFNGIVKKIKVCGACQKKYVCDGYFANPDDEVIDENGWINESMEGLPLPKAPLKYCIKEDQTIRLVAYGGECIKKYQCDPDTYEEIYYIDSAVVTLKT